MHACIHVCLHAFMGGNLAACTCVHTCLCVHACVYVHFAIPPPPPHTHTPPPPPPPPPSIDIGLAGYAPLPIFKSFLRL